MTTTLEQLEKRLTRVERDVQSLKLQPRVANRGWRRIVGSVRHDKVYAEITRLGAEYRRQQTEP